MIDFSRSTFTWHNHPWTPDPYYRYAGGFVGEPGQVYHVRFGLGSQLSDNTGRSEWACYKNVCGCTVSERVHDCHPEICFRFPVVSGAWLSATNPS